MNATINGGATPFSSQTEQAAIDVVPVDVKVFFSTQGTVVGAGTPGLNAWQSGSIVAIGDPDFDIEPGRSSGQLSLLTSYLRTAAGDGDVTVDALHFVSHDMTVGQSTQIGLQTGDLLVSVANTETLTGSDALSITVGPDDVFVFRPITGDDYSSGRFLFLLDNPDGSGNAVLGLSLVEYDILVGDRTLAAGSFIYSVDTTA